MEHENIVEELKRRLEAFWSKAYHRCNEFYYDYDRGYEELENEPFECDLSAARMRIGDGGVAVEYSAAHVHDMCTNFCGGREDDDEGQCGEVCLKEAAANAKRVFDAYKGVVDRWAKKHGVSYIEELRRDGLNFTLIIRVQA